MEIYDTYWYDINWNRDLHCNPYGKQLLILCSGRVVGNDLEEGQESRSGGSTASLEMMGKQVSGPLTLPSAPGLALCPLPQDPPSRWWWPASGPQGCLGRGPGSVHCTWPGSAPLSSATSRTSSAKTARESKPWKTVSGGPTAGLKLPPRLWELRYPEPQWSCPVPCPSRPPLHFSGSWCLQ